MKEENYIPFKKFIIRVPLLAFDSDITKEKVLSLISDDLIQESIYIASPILYKELIKYSNSDTIDNKVIYSIARYLSRMSTRCTPFGLFAGCNVGNITNRTNIILKDSFVRKTRLDMFYLCELYASLINIPEIKNGINFYPNTSMYRLGENYRYVEMQHDNKPINYQISEVERNKFIDKIFKISHNGVTISQIIQKIEASNISKDEVADFVDQLIDSQILVAELSNSVTGADYLERIIHLLHLIKKIPSDIPEKLEDINELLRYERNGLKKYEEITDIVRSLSLLRPSLYSCSGSIAQV